MLVSTDNARGLPNGEAGRDPDSLLPAPAEADNELVSTDNVRTLPNAGAVPDSLLPSEADDGDVLGLDDLLRLDSRNEPRRRVLPTGVEERLALPWLRRLSRSVVDWFKLSLRLFAPKRANSSVGVGSLLPNILVIELPLTAGSENLGKCCSSVPTGLDNGVRLIEK